MKSTFGANQYSFESHCTIPLFARLEPFWREIIVFLSDITFSIEITSKMAVIMNKIMKYTQRILHLGVCANIPVISSIFILVAP
jgi:hypothetical protein